MSTVYLTSDLHIGHKNICKYRPEFSTPEEHNETMIENVLSTVGKRDVLWLLGDVVFDEKYSWFYGAVAQQAQQVNLILGNHCTENNKRQQIILEAIYAGVKVHSLVSYKKTWLCHHPIHPHELRGKVCIHGHMHREILMDNRYYNVCVEHTGWKPIKFNDIADEFKMRGVL